MIEIFKAKSVITVNPSLPRTEVIAVRDGRIIETGSLESLKPWLKNNEFTIHNDFEESIIVPGLIDPHLHPSMAAVLLPTYFITAMEWKFPWGLTKALVRPHGNFHLSLIHI